MENHLSYPGIVETAELIRTGKISPVDVVKHCLEKIELLNPQLHAFITVLGDQALQEAKTAEDEISKGNWKGYLHGIPVAVKDFYDTAGIRTTAGSVHFKDRIPKKDADIVTSLKKNGAILIGKTNMHEFGMGTTSLVSYFGSVHNPWNDKYVAGGSSGGSAAAVASGMCYATVDTDAVGSCRLPAACCGIMGLKVSNGLISMNGILEGEQADPMILLLAATGISARSVADAAIILDALSDDPKSGYYEGLSHNNQLKIGVVKNFNASKEVKDAFSESVIVLESLGYDITTVEVPFEKARFDPTNIAEDRKSVDTSLFKTADILALPTMTTTTPTVDEAKANGPQAVAADNTFFSNYFGLPAVSLCCGFDENGMPLALQLVAASKKENNLLAVAQRFQETINSQLRNPKLVS